MDAERFDAMTRILSRGVDRRRALAGFLGGALSAALGKSAAAQIEPQPCDPRRPLNDPNNCPPCHFCGAIPPGPDGQPRGNCVPAPGHPCGFPVLSQCVHCQLQPNLPFPGLACVVDPGFCSIDGTCVRVGPNPQNECQVCDPARNPNGWTNRPDGSACADDGNPCTADECINGQCRHSGDTSGGCLIDGACVPPGTTRPGNACQVCDPDRDATGWSNRPNGAACDDGNACTRSDTCQAGACVGGDPVVCRPLDQCHIAGVCDPDTGDCSNPVAEDGTRCDDDNVCTTGDVCRAGVCVGETKTCPGRTECCPQPGNHLGRCVARQACLNSSHAQNDRSARSDGKTRKRGRKGRHDKRRRGEHGKRGGGKGRRSAGGGAKRR